MFASLGLSLLPFFDGVDIVATDEVVAADEVEDSNSDTLKSLAVFWIITGIVCTLVEVTPFLIATDRSVE